MNNPKASERKKLARRSVEPPPKERFELMFEQIIDHVKALGEGHANLDRKLNVLAESHAELRHETSEFRAEVSERFTAQDAKIDSVAKDVSAHRAEMKANFAVTNGKLDAVARDLKEHRADSAAHVAVH